VSGGTKIFNKKNNYTFNSPLTSVTYIQEVCCSHAILNVEQFTYTCTYNV